MYAGHYFAHSYFPIRYFPDRVPSKPGYFHHNYFPVRFYTNVYFPGHTATGPFPPEPQPPEQVTSLGAAGRPFVYPIPGRADLRLAALVCRAFGELSFYDGRM